MKKTYISTIVVLSLTAIIQIACKKETNISTRTNAVNATDTITPITPPQVGSNNSFKVNAGKDFSVMASPDFFYLSGLANMWGPGSFNGFKWEWRNLVGPNTISFENKNSGYTRVNGIVKGKYVFELTLTDPKSGKMDKDTLTVDVLKLSQESNEAIIKNTTWNCDMGFCSLELKNVFNLIPPQTGFLVFVKRVGSLDWILIAAYVQTNNPWSENDNMAYYMLREGNLLICFPGDNFTDTPDIKLVY